MIWGEPYTHQLVFSQGKETEMWDTQTHREKVRERHLEWHRPTNQEMTGAQKAQEAGQRKRKRSHPVNTLEKQQCCRSHFGLLSSRTAFLLF